ncbi:MAG: Sec-independent protein translocase subunit TatA [Pseudomonadota bacterium]
MGLGSPMHWVIVLVIVLLIFGTKKLRNIGGDLGAAVKGFNNGIKGLEERTESDTLKFETNNAIEVNAVKEQAKI